MHNPEKPNHDHGLKCPHCGSAIDPTLEILRKAYSKSRMMALIMGDAITVNCDRCQRDFSFHLVSRCEIGRQCPDHHGGNRAKRLVHPGACPFCGYEADLLDRMQAILITRFSGGGFMLCHKHRDFTEEAYGSQSVKGLLNQVENILHGYKPDISDTYRKDDGLSDIHCSNKQGPQPLD